MNIGQILIKKFWKIL